MERSELGSVVREAGGRIVAALAARFRNLDIAEEALAEACVKAAETWPRNGRPSDPAAWLYVAARRSALDSIRRRQTRERLIPDEPPPALTPEENMMDDGYIIPDERLRLIFVCCHPALSVDARVMLTLRASAASPPPTSRALS